MKRNFWLIGIALAFSVTACSGITSVVPTVAPVVQPIIPPTRAAPTATPLPTATPPPPTATPVPTSVNPLDALTKMFSGWASVKTFRAKMTTTTATGTPAPQEFTLEVVTPDRFHMTSKSIEAIKIGAVFYMKIGNAWQKVALPQSVDFSFGDVKKLQSELGASTDVKFLGAEVLDGTPTLTYQYTTSIKTPTPTTTTSKVWVAVADGLPRRMESVSKTGAKTVITLYDYNASFSIDAPIK